MSPASFAQILLRKADLTRGNRKPSAHRTGHVLTQAYAASVTSDWSSTICRSANLNLSLGDRSLLWSLSILSCLPSLLLSSEKRKKQKWKCIQQGYFCLKPPWDTSWARYLAVPIATCLPQEYWDSPSVHWENISLWTSDENKSKQEVSEIPWGIFKVKKS